MLACQLRTGTSPRTRPFVASEAWTKPHKAFRRPCFRHSDFILDSFVKRLSLSAASDLRKLPFFQPSPAISYLALLTTQGRTSSRSCTGTSALVRVYPCQVDIWALRWLTNIPDFRCFPRSRTPSGEMKIIKSRLRAERLSAKRRSLLRFFRRSVTMTWRRILALFRISNPCRRRMYAVHI